MLSSCPKTSSVSSAPNPAERQPREDRERVDEALVQDAQHQVDHQDRHDQQHQRHAGLGAPGTACAVPAKLVLIVDGRHLARRRLHPLHRVAERRARREVERERDRRAAGPSGSP